MGITLTKAFSSKTPIDDAEHLFSVFLPVGAVAIVRVTVVGKEGEQSGGSGDVRAELYDNDLTTPAHTSDNAWMSKQGASAKAELVVVLRGDDKMHRYEGGARLSDQADLTAGEISVAVEPACYVSLTASC